MLEKFIIDIIKSREVFVLEDKNGVAFSHSINFTLDNNDPVPVICFWSTLESAQKSCVSDWADFKAVTICLATFIEDYLVQIYNDSLIVGLNFDEEMIGLEMDPLDLILKIIEKIKEHKIEIEFEYFKNLVDLENQIKKIIAG